jgi:hypothetical protein
MKRIIGGVLLAMAASAHAQVGNPGGAINDRLGDVDYGVCRGVDPQCYHDWPRAAVKQYRVLLYTHTAGPRHANLGAPLAAGLNPALGADNVAQREMVRIAGEQGWAIDYTEDPKEMVNLSGYNAVIFSRPRVRLWTTMARRRCGNICVRGRFRGDPQCLRDAV